MKSNRIWYQDGLRDGVPIALGYFAVAFTLGIAARNAGFSAFQAAVSSLLNHASAGEYAVISLVAAGAGYWEMAVQVLQLVAETAGGELLPLRLDEEGVDVDGPVVADPGDVQAQLGHGPAGLEEGPHVVGHGGDEGLSHVSLLIVSSLVSYHGGTRMKSPA